MIFPSLNQASPTPAHELTIIDDFKAGKEVIFMPTINVFYGLNYAEIVRGSLCKPCTIYMIQPWNPAYTIGLDGAARP
jgi:hypothetical protein